MFSGVRLGDGFLYLYELYNLQLNADLLTLSGCATGLNVVADGDELVGLIRGALYAGARSLLLTLWEVNDRSATMFMTSFYKLFQESEKGRGRRSSGTRGARALPSPLPLGAFS